MGRPSSRRPGKPHFQTLLLKAIQFSLINMFTFTIFSSNFLFKQKKIIFFKLFSRIVREFQTTFFLTAIYFP